MNDLDDLLARSQALCYLGTERSLFHPRRERLHNSEVHISLEERDTDLPEGRIDIVLAEASFAAELVEHTTKA